MRQLTDGSICIVSSNPSGHLLRWVRGLPKSRRVAVLDLSAKVASTEFSEHCRYVKLKIKGANLLRAAISLLAVLKEARGYEYVNIHYVNLFLAAVSLAFRNKVMLSFWGSDGIVGYGTSSGLTRSLYDAALRRCARITYNSSILEERLGAYRAKLRRVDWPIETELFHPFASRAERVEARRARGIGADDIVLLSVRPLLPLYRIRELIEACTSCMAEAKATMIVHVPPNSDQAYLESCRRAAEGLSVQFSTEFLSPGQLSALYGISDFYLTFPVSDSYPSSMIEAMACGCMVLASDETEAYAHIRKDFSIETVGLSSLDAGLFSRLSAGREAAFSANDSVIRRSFTYEAFSRALEKAYD